MSRSRDAKRTPLRDDQVCGAVAIIDSAAAADYPDTINSAGV
jgi:hypothetical protein